MKNTIKLNLPIHVGGEDFLYDLNSTSPDKFIDELGGVEFEKNIFIQNETLVENPIFYCKDVCVSYEDNRSIDSVKVPSEKDYWFIKKTNNSYAFTKTNPKIYRELSNIGNSGEQSYESHMNMYSHLEPVVAKPEAIGSNRVVYSFPHGGLSLNSKFFVVTKNRTVYPIDYNELDYIIDHAEGNVYVNSDSYIQTIIGYYNLTTVKIVPKGNLISKESQSGFYKVVNSNDRSYVTVEYLPSSSKAVVTTTKAIIVEISGYSVGDESTVLTIDGVPHKQGDKIFINKNESFLVEYIETSEGLNTEFMNSSTSLLDSMGETAASSIVLNESTNQNEDISSFLNIYINEGINDYNLEPIRLLLF